MRKSQNGAAASPTSNEGGKERKLHEAMTCADSIASTGPEGVIDGEKRERRKMGKSKNGTAASSASNERGKERKLKRKTPANSEGKEGQEEESSKKARVENMEVIGDGKAAKAVNPNAVSSFNLCGALREKLKSKGVQSLFLIPNKTCNLVFRGVGRARTQQDNQNDVARDEKMKASAAVRHLLIPGAYHAQSQIVADIISAYGSGGRCIIFTETENDAFQLAGSLTRGPARALHGSIPRAARESKLAAFRSGQFNMLVVTDVAAGWLDMNDVQLVIQCEPRRDAETYIHRTGCSGRAGEVGISVMLCDCKKEYMIPQIERKAGFKFEHINAPQPADIAKASSATALDGVH